MISGGAVYLKATRKSCFQVEMGLKDADRFTELESYLKGTLSSSFQVRRAQNGCSVRVQYRVGSVDDRRICLANPTLSRSRM